VAGAHRFEEPWKLAERIQTSHPAMPMDGT
jgi:hypothetical protein